MRVLHVVTRLTGGGAERFVASLTPQLARNVSRCGVLTVNPTAIPEAVASAPGLDVLEIRRRGRFDAPFLARMISQMRAWRPDVVHTHMFHGTYWGRLSAIVAGVPAIVRTEHLPCDPQARVRGTAVADLALNTLTASVVTFFMEQGRFLAAYERFNERKLAIIPNGIAHEPVPTLAEIANARSRLDVSADTFAIFVLGNLFPHKNQALALETFAALDEATRTRARLFFLGDGIDRPHLESLARARGIAEAVTFLGFRSDATELLPGADLLLMPSRSEGMPLALLEAMSAGVPVVSTPWFGAKEMLRNGELGTIAKDFEPATLAGCVQSMMDDPDRARRVAKRTQAVVRADYDIAGTASRHCGLYESLLSQRSVA